MYIIGSLQLETRYSSIHAFILRQFNLWNWDFKRGGTESGKKTISYIVTGLGMYKYDYVKSVSGWLFVLSCRVFCAHWVGGSHCVRLIRTELHPPLTLFGDSLQQLLGTTAALYRHFSVLLGDTLKSKLKVSNSLFVVNCLNISHAHTLQYSWVLWFFSFFFFSKLPCKFITDFANVCYISIMYTVSF